MEPPTQTGLRTQCHPPPKGDSMWNERIRPVVLALAVAGLLAAPSALIAAPAADTQAKAAAADHGHGADKLGPFSDIKRYDLGIWTLLVFGLLFVILAKFAWGPFTEGLRKREEGILAARDEAVRARREAEELRGKLKAEFDAAHEKIRALMDEARRDADALKATEREAGAREAATERERAKREIETAKEQALQEIYQKSVQLAALMSSKAVRRTLTADDHARLVDESLAELNTTAGRA